MKKTLTSILLWGSMALAPNVAHPQCTTIKDGVLVYPQGHYLAGQPFRPGFDPYGYNYQAHLFNGYYANAQLGTDGFPPYEGEDDAYLAANPAAESLWYWPYRKVAVSMKWNDAWLSKVDCDSDGLLDRHYGFASYVGSGAWLTNHQSDTYELGGKLIHWTYFVKIVAAPAEATCSGPGGTDWAGYTYACTWMASDGVSEIGRETWEEFATIQEVYNDPGAELHGVQYKSPLRVGFGYYADRP